MVIRPPLYNVKGPPSWAYAAPAISNGIAGYFNGRRAAARTQNNEANNLATRMYRQAQANKLNLESQGLQNQFDAQQNLGDSFNVIDRMNRGQAPNPTPSDSGQFFRQTQPQQAESNPGAYGDSLANLMIGATGKTNAEQAAGMMGKFQDQRQQNQVFSNPDIPDLARANLAYGKPAQQPYSQNGSGQILNEYTGGYSGGPLMDANINKLNRVSTKEDVLKNLPSEIEKLFNTPALDSSGRPIADPFTGRQATNLDQGLMNDFILFRNQNRIADPYQAYSEWKASKQAAPQPAVPDTPAQVPQENGIISQTLDAIPFSPFRQDQQAAPQQNPPGGIMAPNAKEQLLAEARNALFKKAPPEAVMQRLKDMGIDPGEL